MSSKNTKWLTPRKFRRVLRKFAKVGLDPAGHKRSIMRAAKQYLLAHGEDGLVLTWAGFGLVYVNPPYSREVVAWMQKAVKEARRGVEIVMLVAARTDTIWWHKYATKAKRICFWRGRLKFLGAPNSAPFPSAVLYFGPHTARFEHVFSGYGYVTQSTARKRYHGCTHEPWFRSYEAMIRRAAGKHESPSYQDVTVCDRWLNDPRAFGKWALANGWKPGLTIERKDPKKGYNAYNCEWVPKTVNVSRSHKTSPRHHGSNGQFVGAPKKRVTKFTLPTRKAA